MQHFFDSNHSQCHTLDLINTQPGFIPDHDNVDLSIVSDHSLDTCYLSLLRLTSARRLITRRLNTIDTGLFIDAVRCSPICVKLDLLANMSTDSLFISDWVTSYTWRHWTVNRASPSLWLIVHCRLGLTGNFAPAADVYVHWSGTTEDSVCLMTMRHAWKAALEDKRALFTLKEQQYWTRQLHDCAGDFRRLWRTFNSILMHDEHHFPWHCVA